MNENREACGAKRAGESIGGQFAPSLRTEADGSGLEWINHRAAADAASARAAELAKQITALQVQHAAALRSELRHHVRDAHSNARYVAVIESQDGDEHTYETVGVLDEHQIIIETKSDGGQSSTSSIIVNGQASDAFGFEEADGEITEAVGIYVRSDERMVLIDLDESDAAA